MTFRDLDEVEQRLRIVEGYLAQIPALEGSPELAPATRTALQRAKRALCEDLESEERQYELQVWHEHLDTLSEHDADAATYELKRFTQILGGLARPGSREEEGEPGA